MEAKDAEIVSFKKKLEKYKKYRGRGTQLISLYLPSDADRSSVMTQLTAEMSQSSNIKSPQTRKNVQGALRKIINYLKVIDFKLPENGIVVFCGNISDQEGSSDIRLFTLRPPKPLRVKLYWCDSVFHLTPLEEMASPDEFYGLVALDKREATIALLANKRYDVQSRLTSGVPGKVRAGGQSAQRFERLREVAAHEFFVRIAERVNEVLLPLGEKLKGIVIGGPGPTKNYFLNQELLDSRLRQKVLGVVDVTYTDEAGIREVMHKSGDLLKHTEAMKEKKLVEEFFEQLVKDGLVVYGKNETEQALEEGKVATILVSEGLSFFVYVFSCAKCGRKETIVSEKEIASPKCPECGIGYELLEEADYLDYLLDKAKNYGSEVRTVSVESAEGQQFLNAFGGIGAMLRYK